MVKTMPTIHTFMTKEDERVFTQLVVERFPDVIIIDHFIWPTPAPEIKNSIDDCSSSSVVILKPDIVTIASYSKRVRLREESNGYEGARIGPGLIQFLRSKHADYDPQSLQNGRLSATYDPKRDQAMDIFVKSVYKIFKKYQVKLYCINRDTGEIGDKANASFFSWSDAARSYDGKDGCYLTCHKLLYFVPAPSASEGDAAVATNIGKSVVPGRLSYEESWKRVNDPDDISPPPVPSRMPRYDDDILGISFFRTLVEKEDLSCLTLPRTFFGRSEINETSFRNTDLSESSMCWNDFIEVDFSEASLVGCDARKSTFSKVTFTSADLSRADFRGSTFEDCDFAGAHMHDTILTREQGKGLVLSNRQETDIAWTDEAGQEPDGG